MNRIGMGLKRINDELQQRVKCEVLGINQYRLENNKVEYQVFWKGTGSDIQMSWETIQNLQQCKDEVKRVVTQKKTKGISKRRPAFPTHQNRNIQKPYQKPIKQNSTKIISLIPDLEKSLQNSNASESIPSEEGEIKLQYCQYNHVPINQIEKPQKNQHFLKQQQFQQHELQINISQHSESLPAVKKNEMNEKSTFYSNKTSQSHSQVDSTLQVSEKLQPQSQITEQKSQQKSVNFKIHSQSSCHFTFKPKVNKKSKETMTQVTKSKEKLKLSSNQTSISVEPMEKENVLVTKLIRDGNKIFFQIMVYNEEGKLTKQRISSQQLRIKAPYALLKYYQSRIIS